MAALPEFYTMGVLHGLQIFRIALLVRPDLKFYELLALCEDVVQELRRAEECPGIESYTELIMKRIRERNR